MMKFLAVSWANAHKTVSNINHQSAGTDGDSNNAVPELQPFEFVFFVALKKVKDNRSVEQIVLDQHPALKLHKVQLGEITSILNGHTENNVQVLLLIDGYDEYKADTNQDIDAAIKRECLNCSIILTSRENDELQKIKEAFKETEAEICGFEKEQIVKFANRCLENCDKTTEGLFEEALLSGLCKEELSYENLAQASIGGANVKDFGILEIPIFLEMICSVYRQQTTLPTSKGGILNEILPTIVKREDKRSENQCKRNSDELNNIILKLGKLAWKGLNGVNQKRLVFTEVSVNGEACYHCFQIIVFF